MIIYDPSNSAFALITDSKVVDGKRTFFLQQITTHNAPLEYHQAADEVVPVDAQMLEVMERDANDLLRVISKVKQIAGIKLPPNVVPVDFAPPQRVKKS